MARRGSNDGRLHAELERLYALPPDAFTAARNELAVRLRREGQRDAAATVKALPRPTPSSWAVSRLMRLERARFQALLTAGQQARQAQHQVVGGRAPSSASSAGAAARLREALQSAKTLIEELRRRGLELLAASGRPATAANAERLSANLQALAFTAGAESTIERGWLDGDLDAPGFEVLAGLQAAAGPATARAQPAQPAARPTPSRKAPVPEAGAEAGRRRQESLLRQETERREREQARLQQARERRQARLNEAEAEVERAAAEWARLQAAAAAAEAAAADARRQAAAAQREAERARSGAEQASRQLDRARERLQAVRAAAEPGLKA